MSGEISVKWNTVQEEMASNEQMKSRRLEVYHKRIGSGMNERT